MLQRHRIAYTNFLTHPLASNIYSIVFRVFAVYEDVLVLVLYHHCTIYLNTTLQHNTLFLYK